MYESAFKNYASLLGQLGQHQQELDVLQLLSRKQNRFDLSTANNIATAFQNLGKLDSAFSYYKWAETTTRRRTGDKNPELAKILSNLGRNYELRKQNDSAAVCYREALQILTERHLTEHLTYAELLAQQAVLACKMGNCDTTKTRQALNIVQKALKNNRVNNNYLTGLEHHIFTLEPLSKTPQILDSLGSAQGLMYQYLTDNLPSLPDAQRLSFFDNTETLGNELRSLMWRQIKTAPTQAAEWFYDDALNFKGIVLRNTEGFIRAMESDTTNAAVQNRWLQLKSIQQKLNNVSDLSPSQSQNLSTQAQKLEEELAQHSDVYKAQKLPPTSWRDVRKVLKEGEVAIEFQHFKYTDRQGNDSITQYYAVILRGVHAVQLTESRPIIVPLFEEKELSDFFKDYNPAYEQDFINNLYGKQVKKLSTLVWQKIERLLRGSSPTVQRVYFSPSGLLHRVSFGALMGRGDSVLLSNEYELFNLRSTKEIIGLHAKPDTALNLLTTRAAIFATVQYDADSTARAQANRRNDVATTKGATLSSNACIAAFPAMNDAVEREALKYYLLKATYFEGAAATEEAFKHLFRNNGQFAPEILHLSTHGFSIDKPLKEATENKCPFQYLPDPLQRNGVVLAGANHVWTGKTPYEGMEDGILTALEISKLPMSRTKLVVLSACQTALGDVRGGEGIFGFQRALKMAGSEYLLCSLWSVPTASTAEFMGFFYGFLKDGKPIPDAFVDAQDAMKLAKKEDKTPKYTPYDWAAWVLVR